MKSLVGVLACVLWAGPVSAAVRTEPIEYRDGETALQGYIAYDDASTDKRPGVLVVHEWKGLGPYAIRRAEQLARLGYVAMAVDMYGKGVRAKDHEEAGKLSGIYRKDRALTRSRIRAALNVLKANEFVDPGRIAAIGYCFGGMAVLELARSGADILGVVTFHGALDTPNPEDAKQITCKVLVLHGANDGYITQEQVAAFEREMREAGVDYQLIQYPGAVHSFTVREAGDNPAAGAAYDKAADEQSWEQMKAFFQKLFSPSELERIG